ncbi:flap endonuclease GEN isoform X1 [Polistes fuscatus]|uniref:flap endonuclease GEN isoform X1 n=2 Tax=Polistes fuscatus TaxID=30207 RepID=UPI001CA9C3B7|nr:flap endonuclease GEN isoform X1 [Polistes fuscatus]
MGVKDLWNILSPLCERRPLFELQGKVIAIDLSCWIVDSQSVTDNFAQPKMYLRNLFFRTAFLLTQGIIPVFVLEGKAPILKHKTIEKRNNIRAGFQERNTAKKGGRTNFNRILNECKELLKYMGIACVQGEGEAEAMCAYLNEDGLVDGCISQDSDCFLYGAKVVYRNFCMSAQGNRSGTGGAVDEYRIDKIENILNLGRNKMIALALLCGCDYNEGINGVGKEAALKFFKTVSDSCILERIKSWSTDTNFQKVEAELSNPNLCTSCGHTGKLQKHTKSGCIQCGTVIKCKDTYKEERALILNEIQIRKKSLLVEDFPDQELLDEFLIRKDSVPSKLDLKWKQPQIDKYIDFVDKYLMWEPQYAFEKIFPLVTRWQLRYLPNISSDMHLSINNLFMPERIKKVRNIKSIASYEIIWTDITGIREKLKMYHDVSEKENNDDDFTNNELVTIEPQDAVLKCYPDLVESFETEKNKKKAQKKTVSKRQRKITKDPNINNVEEGKTKKPQKRNKKKFTECPNNRKIDEFILKNQPLSLEESFERMSITPKRSKQRCDCNANTNVDCSNGIYLNDSIKRPPQIRKILELEKTNVKLNNTLDKMFLELSPEDFASENEDADLNITGVIDGICNTYTFQCEHKDNKISNMITNDLETVNVSTQDQNFIKNIDSIKCNSIESDNDISIRKDTMNDIHDEFDNIESYVPLYTRIQKRCKINTPRKSKKHTIRTSKMNISRCSFGFDDIMNETDIENV